MDDGLVHYYQRADIAIKAIVLILVVVDDGLVHMKRDKSFSKDCVLILVVVDDGLVL